MSAKYARKTATLDGNVSVEQAEELLAWLVKTQKPVVNVSKVENVHAAVLQVLLAMRPKIQGEPQNPWLRAALTGLASSE